MEKHIYDEKNSLWYQRDGDYYIHLALPEEGTPPVGKYGRMRKRRLKEKRKGLYANLLLTGRMRTYLADIEGEAQDFMADTVRKMAQAEGVTEELKAADQTEWVRRMNSIRCRAEEILFQEIIYA